MTPQHDKAKRLDDVLRWGPQLQSREQASERLIAICIIGASVIVMALAIVHPRLGSLFFLPGVIGIGSTVGAPLCRSSRRWGALLGAVIAVILSSIIVRSLYTWWYRG